MVYPSPVSPTQVIISNFILSYSAMVEGNNSRRVLKSLVDSVTLTWNASLIQKGNWLDLNVMNKCNWSSAISSGASKHAPKNSQNDRMGIQHRNVASNCVIMLVTLYKAIKFIP